MKLRSLAATVILALTAVAAHAQVGLYLNPMFTRISNSTPDTGVFAFLGAGNTSQMFYGVNFGGYYDFYHQGKLTAGVDVRDSIVHGNNASLNSFLVGARVSASPFTMPLKPYIQVSAGAGTTHAPTNSRKSTKGQYGVFVGADYALNHHIDFRAIEVGYSSLQTISSSSVGGSDLVIPSSTLLSFSTGFVFRF